MNWHNSFVRGCARVRHTSARETNARAGAIREEKRRTTASMANRLNVTAHAEEMRLKCAAETVLIRCTSSVRLRSRVSSYPHRCQVGNTPQAPLSSSSGARSILNIWGACISFLPWYFRIVHNHPRHCRVNGTPMGHYFPDVMRLGDSSSSLFNFHGILQLTLLRMKLLVS